MKSKKNVVLFIVDSVRYYSAGGLDDRDKLDMMDSFEKESVYFPLTVTSAPSSIMSLSTMLTSLPAYYIARNYDDFRYDNNQFISLHNILKDEGYSVKSLFNARELRFLFGDVIDHVEEKYWPKGVNTNQKNWSNATMNVILENFLESKTMEEPFFMVCWYNVRHDADTSDHIQRGIDILKENNLWDDSVFILGSDHGYMDPKRGYTPEKLEAMGLSHDLLMTDDNIRIPFYLRYPGSPVKRVEQQVSTLDFLPTILSLVDVPYPESKTYQMSGLDLVPLINEDEEAVKVFTKRKVRSDARFFAQADRSTALRDGRYKYVTRPDQNIEEFYDVPNDEWEENNLIENEEFQDIIQEFRSEYQRSENEIMAFQTKYLLSKLPKSLKKAKPGTSLKVAIIGTAQPYYLDNLSTIFKEFWGDDAKVDLIVSEKVASDMQNTPLYNNCYKYDVAQEKIFTDTSVLDNQYNYAIVLTDSRNESKIKAEQQKIMSLLKVDKELSLNPNMEFVAREKTLRDPKLILRVLKEKRSYYFKNPGMIFNHFVKWINIVAKK